MCWLCAAAGETDPPYIGLVDKVSQCPQSNHAVLIGQPGRMVLPGPAQLAASSLLRHSLAHPTAWHLHGRPSAARPLEVAKVACCAGQCWQDVLARCSGSCAAHACGGRSSRVAPLVLSQGQGRQLMSGEDTSQCWCCVQVFRKRGAKKLREERDGPVYRLSDFGVHVSKPCPTVATLHPTAGSAKCQTVAAYALAQRLQQCRQHVSVCKMYMP
jgi:hypothetical protein